MNLKTSHVFLGAELRGRMLIQFCVYLFTERLLMQTFLNIPAAKCTFPKYTRKRMFNCGIVILFCIYVIPITFTFLFWTVVTHDDKKLTDQKYIAKPNRENGMWEPAMVYVRTSNFSTSIRFCYRIL